jgi:hypothetical protein
MGLRRAPRGLALIAGLVLVALVTLAPAPAGTGQEGGGDTTSTAVPAPHIIPRPNSGAEPTEAGDRGGALQVAVFVIILAGVGGITALAVRDSRRARRSR